MSILLLTEEDRRVNLSLADKWDYCSMLLINHYNGYI